LLVKEDSLKILKLRFLALGVLLVAMSGLCGAQAAAPAATPDTSKSGTKATMAKTKSAPVDPSTIQQAPGGGGGKVWCNTNSNVYHKEGDPWYGKTKKGQYMTVADAEKAGCKEAKESPMGKKDMMKKDTMKKDDMKK
jgi:hypothetical protein